VTRRAAQIIEALTDPIAAELADAISEPGTWDAMNVDEREAMRRGAAALLKRALHRAETPKT
jgi:hypothetical protein